MWTVDCATNSSAFKEFAGVAVGPWSGVRLAVLCGAVERTPHLVEEMVSDLSVGPWFSSYSGSQYATFALPPEPAWPGYEAKSIPRR